LNLSIERHRVKVKHACRELSRANLLSGNRHSESREMQIVAEYSFNDGKQFLEKNHKPELKEVRGIISSVKGFRLKTKISKESTMKGRALYNPIALNKEFKELLKRGSWKTGTQARIKVKTFVPEIGLTRRGFREMDAIKNKVGIEVQLGKYAFMVYNVAAKMTIFSKQCLIDSGIEIVPMKSLADEMSTGVSSFEQIKTDLEMRGVSNIDIPVLILGIDVRRPRRKKLLLNP